MDGSILEINGYVINYIDGIAKMGNFVSPVEDIENQTTAIKYDPVDNTKCDSGDSCYNWYVLEDKGIEYSTVSLIMDSNIGTDVTWCLDEGNNNACNGDGAKAHLATATITWTVEAKLPTNKQILSTIGNRNNTNLPDWLIKNLDGG